MLHSPYKLFRSSYSNHPRIWLMFFSFVPMCLFWRVPWFLTLLEAAVSYTMLKQSRFQKNEMVLYFYCALSGALMEFTAIFSGAWFYAKPDLLLIPSWLPLVWGNAGLIINRFIEKKQKKAFRANRRARILRRKARRDSPTP